MKRGTLFLLTFILLVPIVTGQPYIWEKTGFSETMIQSTMGRLIAHPTDPGTLFLATVNSYLLYAVNVRIVRLLDVTSVDSSD